MRRLDSPVRGIVKALRDVVRKSAPALEEVIRRGRLCYRNRDDVCAIAAHKSHVSLQFWRGSGLSDPEALLEGTGKGMRRIKIAGRLSPSQPRSEQRAKRRRLEPGAETGGADPPGPDLRLRRRTWRSNRGYAWKGEDVPLTWTVNPPSVFPPYCAT